MDIAALTEKAVALRRHFDDVVRQSGKRAWSKEEIMQGFVVDVGALMKLVMAKSGARDVHDVDKKLAHELSDCLWSVLVLARAFEIDLEKEFLGMIKQTSVNLDVKKDVLSVEKKRGHVMRACCPKKRKQGSCLDS